jgi:hypothetical protein
MLSLDFALLREKSIFHYQNELLQEFIDSKDDRLIGTEKNFTYHFMW